MKRKILLDSSTLNDSTCLKKVGFTNVYGLRAPDTTDYGRYINHDVNFGQALHLGLRLVRRGVDKRVLVNELYNYLEHTMPSDEFSNEVKCPEAVVDIIIKYMARSKHLLQKKLGCATLESTEEYPGPWSERFFVRPLLNLEHAEFYICGVVDLVVKRDDNKICFVDDKTTYMRRKDKRREAFEGRNFFQQYFAQHEHGVQVCTYSWLIKEHFGLNYLPDAAIEAFFVHRKDNAGDFATIWHSDWIEMMPKRVDAVIKDFHNLAYKINDQLSAEGLKIKNWIPHTPSCAGSYGKACRFYNICWSHPVLATRSLNSFIRTVYDPSKFGEINLTTTEPNPDDIV